jgi:5'-3' exoribonuclease 2
LVKVQRGANRLYVLHLETARPLCLAAHKDDEAWHWHEHYGHLHFDALHKFAKNDMVHRLLVIKNVRQFYDTYVITKQRRAPFPTEAEYHAQELLELIHGDLYGPVTLVTPSSRRYFLLLVDDAILYMWVALLTTKDAATDAIKQLQAVTEKGSGHKLRVLRTDNGREFTTVEFAIYYADEGIQHQLNAPTRRNRTELWRGETRRWWPWRGLCSSSVECRPSIRGRWW